MKRLPEEIGEKSFSSRKSCLIFTDYRLPTLLLLVRLYHLPKYF